MTLTDFDIDAHMHLESQQKQLGIIHENTKDKDNKKARATDKRQ